MAKIGIDFGTTNSSLVAFDKESGQFSCFTSTGTPDKPTPSVVWYHDKHVIVGKTAKEKVNAFSNMPGHHIETSIKSKLGSGKKISVLGRLVQPYEIVADIIKHIKKTAETEKADSRNTNYNQAVVTIPINFNGKQREELRKAFNLAGISIDTFIHEPFAALIGFMHTDPEMKKTLTSRNSHVLVFDWGGGTLDITIVKIEQNRLWELSTSELTGIAGDKFDEELMNLFSNRFIEKHSDKFPIDFLQSKLGERNDALRMFAEECKIALSAKFQENIQIDEIFYDDANRKYYDYTDVINRNDFEKSIQHHVDAAINKINIAIKQAGISNDQISLVLMTGGSSNIPLVKRAVEDKFGSRVCTPQNPDLVIAQGAAVVNEMNWSPYLSKNLMVELSDQSSWVIFEQNMPLVRERMPEKKEVFTCVDNRDSEAKLIITEGCSSNIKDKNLAIINIPIQNDIRTNSPDDIEVSFMIDENIVLHIAGYGLNKRLRKKEQIHHICFGVEMR